jgi:hypothetical protein
MSAAPVLMRMKTGDCLVAVIATATARPYEDIGQNLMLL